MVNAKDALGLDRINHFASRFARAIATLPHAAAVLALLLIGAAGIGPARAADPAAMGWTIVEAGGEARYRLSQDDDAAWNRAAPGTLLKGAARLETGANGRLVVARGGDTIVMSPGSRILLPEPAPEAGVTRVFQALGVSLYKIMKRAPHLLVSGTGAHGFEVHTPYLVSTVKGTTFAVSVTGQGASVDLLEGVLRVSTADESFSTEITGGHLARVAAGAPRTIEVIGADGTGRRSLGREARADVPEDPRWDGKPATGASATGGVEADSDKTSVTVVIDRSGGALARELAGRPAPDREAVRNELVLLNRDLAGLGNGRGVLLEHEADDEAAAEGCVTSPGATGACTEGPGRGPTMEMSSIMRSVPGGSLVTSGGLNNGLSNPGAGGLTNTVGSTTGSVVNSVGSTTGGLVNTVGSTTGSVVNSVGSTTGGLVNTVGSTTGSVVNTVNSTSGGLVNTLGSTTSGLLETVETVGGGLVNTVGSTTGGLVETVGSTTSGVTNTLSDTVGGLLGLGGGR